MASIQLETIIHAPAEQVWAALAAVGEAHRAFAGVLSGCRLEREDVRVVTFVNGLVVKEQIVDVDPTLMRIAYAVIESELAHHSASMQVGATTDRACRFVWITDVLPHDAAGWIRPLMEQGAEALKTNVETLARADHGMSA
jgi:uncharacterized protein YndB with AHSA1/START domain